MSAANITTTNNNNNNNNNNYDTMSIKDLRVLLTLRGFDCSTCVEKSELIAAAQKMDNTNYDDEAHKLFRELNLQPAGAVKSRYSTLDPIWKHANNNNNNNNNTKTTTTTSDHGAVVSGGTVYVGNYRAASDRKILQERNIVAVVNCQDVTSENYFETDPEMHYHRFVVSKLAVAASRSTSAVTSSSSSSPLQGGFQDAFDFVQSHIEKGDSVLIHCLAGAHRAGTMGTAWLMYKTGKGVEEALIAAKACRPVINPFSTLLELLHRLEAELVAKRQFEKNEQQQQQQQQQS